MKRKGFLSVIIVVATIMSFSMVSVHAESFDDVGELSEQGNRYVYIDSVINTLSFSGNTATSTCNVKCVSGVTKIKIHTYLERYDASADKWATYNLNHWLHTYYGRNGILSEPAYNVPTGYKYRDRNVITVYANGSLTPGEQITVYSNEIWH